MDAQPLEKFTQVWRLHRLMVSSVKSWLCHFRPWNACYFISERLGFLTTKWEARTHGSLECGEDRHGHAAHCSKCERQQLPSLLMANPSHKDKGRFLWNHSQLVQASVFLLQPLIPPLPCSFTTQLLLHGGDEAIGVKLGILSHSHLSVPSAIPSSMFRMCSYPAPAQGWFPSPAFRCQPAPCPHVGFHQRVPHCFAPSTSPVTPSFQQQKKRAPKETSTSEKMESISFSCSLL